MPTYPPNNGQVLSPTPQFSDAQTTPATNGAEQRVYQDAVYNGGISLVTEDVTGVTLSFTGQTVPLRLAPGQYTLAFTFAGKLLSIGNGENVDVTAGGTFTLVSATGTKVTAVVVALSLPGQDEADEVIVNRGIGKSSQQILWNQVPDANAVTIDDVSVYGNGNSGGGDAGVTGEGGSASFLMANTAKVVSQPVNVTGVVLSLFDLAGDPLTDQLTLEVGLHDLDFTFSGTTLGIGGGTAVDVSGGGDFLLVSPSGTKVLATVVGASIPGQDESDRITVSNYAANGSKVITDDAFKAQLDDIYGSV